MSIPLALYDRARAAIQARGFDSDVQTRITLFVGAAHGINAAIMSGFELQPQVSVVYPFVHGQYCRELEFASLLARATRWSPNPTIYAESAGIVMPLWTEWGRLMLPLGYADPALVYGALALGHALLARVRLAPVIPDDANALDPFVIAIQRIEQEAGRMIQAQIRLLKDGVSPLGVPEQARIIEAKQAGVDEAFRRFLEWLCTRDATATSATNPFALLGGTASDPWAALRATMESAWKAALRSDRPAQMVPVSETRS